MKPEKNTADRLIRTVDEANKRLTVLILLDIEPNLIHILG